MTPPESARRALQKLYAAWRERPLAEAHLEEAVSCHWRPSARFTRPRATVLYVAMTYDYGRASQGYSFEENNFFHALLHMGFYIVKFDFMTVERRFGRKAMNHLLLEAAFRFRPDWVFTVLFQDELTRETIRELSFGQGLATVNWFCDDHWRYEGFSKAYAPCFQWVATTDPVSFEKYKQLEGVRPLLTQYACNHFLYRKLDLPKLYDVSFIGQPHGERAAVLARMRRAGLQVHAWGCGWPAGRVSQSEMIRIINQSKVVLNLSNASRTGARQQVKGRDFEVPGCGAFLLTGPVDDLRRSYAVGEEIVCYQNLEDLIDKARYYLAHDDERERIARAGHERVLKEHTYEKRFERLLKDMGLEFSHEDSFHR